MDRLLSYGCTPGNDEASLQNDLDLITRHTLQGSAMDLPVDGIFSTESQSRPMGFQHINGLTADDLIGEQTGGKLDEPLLSKPELKMKRTRGGVAGSRGDITGVKMDDSAFGKIPPRDVCASKGGGTTTAQDWWIKSGSGIDDSKPAGNVEGSRGQAMSTYGEKKW